jgi:hypothetical protein
VAKQPGRIFLSKHSLSSRFVSSDSIKLSTGSVGTIPVVLESGQQTTITEKNDAILVYGCDKAVRLQLLCI